MAETQNTTGLYSGLTVGSEIDAKCSKCKQDLMHTITEMTDDGKPKRVRCLTCGGEHVFRKTAAQKAAEAAEKKRAAEAKKARLAKKAKSGGRGDIPEFAVLADGKRIDAPRLYSMTEHFAVGEIIEHPVFGIGIVAVVRGTDKMDVAFEKSGARTLLHNRILPGKIG